jgi:hypothetical protein
MLGKGGIWGYKSKGQKMCPTSSKQLRRCFFAGWSGSNVWEGLYHDNTREWELPTAPWFCSLLWLFTNFFMNQSNTLGWSTNQKDP